MESTRTVMTRSLDAEHSDASVMASGAVFRHMASGDVHRSRDAALATLDFMYHTALDASAPQGGETPRGCVRRQSMRR